MKWIRHAVQFILLLSLSCSSRTQSGQPSSTIYVFAASSLTEAFGQITSAYQTTHPGAAIRLNFGGSQALRTQIEQGAPADVFVSASGTDMNTLVNEGYIAADAPKILLTNRLVVILPPENPAGIQDLRDLARPGVKVVLAAEDVPVGAYARQSLQNMEAAFGNSYQQAVLANVVSNEDNVKQVVAKVQLGEADAGIVYVSDAIATPTLKQIEIPPEWNVVAKYPLAVLKKSSNLAFAQQFIAFLLAPEGQSILQKWGFGPAG